MPTVLESVKSAVGRLWGCVKGSPRELPGTFQVDPAHTDQKKLLSSEIKKDNHYFQVRVNEIYLPYDRQWFVKYEPMVFASTECTYDGKEHVIPTIVGPQLMPKLPSGELPERMLFSNTRVAGLYPYRGGRISLTIVLYRSKRDDVAQRLLRLIQNTAGAIDFSNVINTYLKIANVVVSGIEELAGLGSLDPLLGIRREFDPDAGDLFTPGYYVLTIQPDLDESKLWVKRGQLLFGDTLAQAKPFQGAEYVLYSVLPAAERSDVDTLPIHVLYQEAKKKAAFPGTDNWEAAKASLSALYQLLVTCPDLTPAQAETLSDAYIAELQKIHAKSDTISSLKLRSKPDIEKTAKARRILKMK
jgi:hypothetical protein